MHPPELGQGWLSEEGALGTGFELWGDWLGGGQSAGQDWGSRSGLDLGLLHEVPTGKALPHGQAASCGEDQQPRCPHPPPAFFWLTTPLPGCLGQLELQYRRAFKPPRPRAGATFPRPSFLLLSLQLSSSEGRLASTGLEMQWPHVHAWSYECTATGPALKGGHDPVLLSSVGPLPGVT